MFKQSHKRPRADEDGARELRGIPSHEFGLPHAQVLSSLGFAECLCASRSYGVLPWKCHRMRRVIKLIVSHVQACAQQAAGGRGWSTKCEYALWHILQCLPGTQPLFVFGAFCFCFFDATDVAVLWGEPLLTTTCLNLRFALVQGPQKDLIFRARPLQPNMPPYHFISVYAYVQKPSQLFVASLARY